MYYANINLKKAGFSFIILDKGDFRGKRIAMDKESHCIRRA